MVGRRAGSGWRLGPAVAIAVLMLALPVFKFEEEAGLPVQAHHILENDTEVARFLADADPGRSVIVNDIGEVSRLHGGGLLDLWALGSNDVLRAYRDGTMGRGFVTTTAARDGDAVARWVSTDPAEVRWGS